MGHHDSESPPVRPHRKSPSNRERGMHGGVGKTSSRNRSPMRPKSRSPPHSPLREKPPSRYRSPKRRKSVSPKRDKTAGRRVSPKHPRSTSKSPEFGKSHAKPRSRSPSPRTRRLMRAQVERETSRQSKREHDKNGGSEEDRVRHREMSSDRNDHIGQREQRSGRDSYTNGSSKLRHERSASPTDHRSHRPQHRSGSPAATNRRERGEGTQTRGDDHRNNDSDSVAKMKEAEEALHAKEKEKPSFELSGKLAAETNRYRGITLLFNEPPDARKPSVRWRLYVLKNGEVFNEPFYVHRQSSYLFGRERRVADIPTDHPSCSKQHAVLQYRQVEKENSDGTSSKQIRPYIMDLGSTNGTFINDNRIEPQRYYELLEKDTIKFGNSSREYVLLHENSA